MARIFLCHASEDKAQVRDLYQRLDTIEGFDPWLDEEDLLPGQIWDTEIRQALKESEFILVFFSRNSVAKRGYVQREMKMALDAWEEVPSNTIHTIPVRLDECEIPEDFRRYHRTDLFDPRGFDRLVRSLRFGLEQRGEPLPETSTPSSDDTQTVVEPTSPSQTFTNNFDMEFILIPNGTFMMGSPNSDPAASDREKPTHQVTISEPFWLGRYPVTQTQWQAVMGSNPSRFKGDDYPVETVSWEDAQAFMKTLNEREHVSRYRLPTLAQWEYACRAGTSTRYHFGDDETQLGEYAWYGENSGGQTHPVGQKKPNAWGLYDMHGNVWEWMHASKRPYISDEVTDPMISGGYLINPARSIRAAFRYWLNPDFEKLLIGFRCLSSGREPVSGAALCQAPQACL